MVYTGQHEHKTVSSREVYRNPWLRLREDKIERSNGVHGIYTESPFFIQPSDSLGSRGHLGDYSIYCGRSEDGTGQRRTIPGLTNRRKITESRRRNGM